MKMSDGGGGSDGDDSDGDGDGDDEESKEELGQRIMTSVPPQESSESQFT